MPKHNEVLVPATACDQLRNSRGPSPTSPHHRPITTGSCQGSGHQKAQSNTDLPPHGPTSSPTTTRMGSPSATSGIRRQGLIPSSCPGSKFRGEPCPTYPSTDPEIPGNSRARGHYTLPWTSANHTFLLRGKEKAGGRRRPRRKRLTSGSPQGIPILRCCSGHRPRGPPRYFKGGGHLLDRQFSSW